MTRTTSGYTGRVTNWPLFGGLAGAGVVLVVCWAVFPPHLAVLAVVGVVLILSGAEFTSVSLAVGSGRVVARIGPLGVPRVTIAAANIVRAEAVDVPASRMGGWGLHWSPWRGTRLTIRSGDTLELHLVGGGRVAISAADPAAAADVVNSWR